MLYIVEVVLFRIVPVLAIAVLNVFIIAKVSRITRQKIRIASHKWRGAKYSEPETVRSSVRRRAQTDDKDESREDGILVVDGIQPSASKEVERKVVGLSDSAKSAQIELRSLGRIKLIQSTPFELGRAKGMTSCQSHIDSPGKAEDLNLRNIDLPESQPKQIESAQPDQIQPLTKITQPKQIDCAQPKRMPLPENCSFGELERFDTNNLECAKAFESSQLDPDRPENCRSNQPEPIEPDPSEIHVFTQSNQIQPTKFSQPCTEFTEPEFLAPKFVQPAKLGTEFIHLERLDTAEQQTLESTELKANSANGCCKVCTRHVTSLTRGKNRRKEKKKNGRRASERNEIIEKRKNGRTDEKQEGRKNSRRDGQRDDRSLQMTITLILVSTIHVIVFLPVLVHFVVWKLERSKVIPESPAAMQIAQNHTRVLYIAGFAVNFFLYTVSGRMFREQLRDVLWRRRSSYRCGN